MRIWGAVVIFPAVLAGQQPPSSSALVRGVLLERDPQTASGEFSVRRDDNLVFRYRFDPRTYVERDQQLIDVSRLRPGEKIEVLSDEGPGSSLRYARTVHVIDEPPPSQRRAPPGRASTALRTYRAPVERFLPISTLSFSGVVLRVGEGRLVMHTREAGEQTILLRQDTHYLAQGDTVDAAELKPNMRVFVKAGRTLYNEIEAYQVIWGQILMPH